MLGLGKKVYIRSDITTWELFEELDIKVFDSIKDFDLRKVSLEDGRENYLKIKERFSEEKLYNELSVIFRVNDG